MERLIIKHFQAHNTQEQIARSLNVSKKRVNHAIKEFRITGEIPQALKIGRPTKITSNIQDFIKIKSIQDCTTTNENIAKDIEKNFNVKLSESSVGNTRKKLKFNYSPPRHMQKLTVAHQEARVEFCQKMLQQINVLESIAFSDESRFVLGSDKKWRWIRRGEEQEGSTVSSVKFPQAIMIFGVIGVGYKSRLLIVDSTINTQKYIENCEKVGFINDLNALHGPLNWIFMQDGATCHTAEAAMQYLEEECDVISDWPANSPDLNPIELLWAIMKKRVENRTAISKEQLKQIVQQVWDELDQGLIDRLCKSFEARLRLTIEMNGCSISRHLNMLEGLNQYLTQENRLPWTPEEDDVLMHMVFLHGHNWKSVAKYLNNRSVISCKNRWCSQTRLSYQHFLSDRMDQIIPQK